ncbi:Fe(3+) ABC transporter substrate-binding protein [Leptolyngbya sp. BC1307]|uniref:Fe(3+) ABC transporter substrate-binding protein n=1 Tax=Leptolyngbya sp. BC1307 TaxID=2029589 RepID=UPI000EFBEB52|nr:Fe(3+) ABC transporter substrate-binding protein [Leptolyngbya sp. BC1307]
MKITRRQLWGIALSLSVGITACQSQPGSQSGADQSSDSSEQVINLYSARHYDIDEQLYEEFTAETGIQVNILEGNPDELIERINSEGAQSPADVFVAVDAGRLWRAQEADILQPVDSEVLNSKVPENLREPSGLWFGLTTRARLLVYNPENVQPSELSTYEDLADPKWEGRVCVRSSSNEYNQSLVGSMVESDGVEATENWARGLVANFARQPEGGDTDQIKAVAAGQCDVAIVNHYYWARLAKSDDPGDQDAVSKTALFFPNQEGRGTHINISGMGLVKTAPNPENGIAFMEFLVSPEAQKVFADGNNEYPVVTGIDVDPVVAELGEFKVDEVNVASYGRNNSKVNEIIDRAGWQ